MLSALVLIIQNVATDTDCYLLYLGHPSFEIQVRSRCIRCYRYSSWTMYWRFVFHWSLRHPSEVRAFWTEYVGERISINDIGPLVLYWIPSIRSLKTSHWWTSRVQKFTRINYSFSLTKRLTLDSLTVGNETRYLNHDKLANCRALCKRLLISPIKQYRIPDKGPLVNGVPKIGIYTSRLPCLRFTKPKVTNDGTSAKYQARPGVTSWLWRRLLE